MTAETKNLVPEISPNGKRLNICEYKGTYIYSEPSNERSLEPNLHFLSYSSIRECSTVKKMTRYMR